MNQLRLNTASEVQANDINKVAAFLAHEQIRDLRSHLPVDCIVLCASSVLYGADYVFDAIASRPGLTKTLVLCGGIGHSTRLMYESVEKSSKYQALRGKLDGLPEARVLEQMYACHPGVPSEPGGPQILIEDRSTNCGENASKTWELCKVNNVTPRSIVVVQDPTMSLRTLASFQKVYSESEEPPEFYSCPTFVPKVHLEEPEYAFVQTKSTTTLWTLNRFFELILGEIPRLRNDMTGYGPKGRGFIVKVDIPEDVEASWARLKTSIDSSR